ncbi:hypothetical protein VTK26DRAFT_1326 [Humicola hyalothermophila]
MVRVMMTSMAVAVARLAVLVVLLVAQEGRAGPVVRIRVVHDGVGEHVGELAVELAAVDDGLGRDEVLGAGEPDAAGARVAVGQLGGGGLGGAVAVVDGGADALQVLRVFNHLMVARGVLLADRRGKHVGGPVVDDLLHGGAADLVEGARPEDRGRHLGRAEPLG